jgi:hypothetical protein
MRRHIGFFQQKNWNGASFFGRRLCPAYPAINRSVYFSRDYGKFLASILLQP